MIQALEFLKKIFQDCLSLYFPRRSRESAWAFQSQKKLSNNTKEKIEVKSELGVGSTFIVKLPINEEK